MANTTIYREPAGAGNWNYWIPEKSGKRMPLSANRAMTLVRRDGFQLVTVGEQIKTTPQVPTKGTTP